MERNSYVTNCRQISPLGRMLFLTDLHFTMMFFMAAGKPETFEAQEHCPLSHTLEARQSVQFKVIKFISIMDEIEGLTNYTTHYKYCVDFKIRQLESILID